ncbi:MAG: hypothetical protein M3Y34_02785 [Actinomycetota bacterium]|nr:hypothetical protein [Actinomycetota bacterium]
MSKAASSRARAALASAIVIAAAGLAACDAEQKEANAAANAVELARYLPEDTEFLRTVDVVRARDELELPEEANALPTSNKTFPRPGSPEATLFKVTSGAYPDVSAVFAADFNGRGASPLDGTLIRAAAGGGQGVSIVSTAEPIDDIDRKLELAGYSLEGRFYEAGDETPEAASRFVADAGNGRIVFAAELRYAREVLRRIRNEAAPGRAAEALEPASGSVRLAVTNREKRDCVTAFAAAMEATSEGAALALIIDGDKPEPERFDRRALTGIATGTPTVLVDALLVPIRVKKPVEDGLDAVDQVVVADDARRGRSDESRQGALAFEPAPFDSYKCP